MASTRISYIFFLFLLFSCIWTQISGASNEKAKQNDDSIDKVCTQAVWTNFCLKTLRPYPRSATADLSGIAKVSLDLALSHASTTKSLIDTLFKQVRDPKNKTLLTDCSNYFDKAIMNINVAKDSLVVKDYGNICYRAALAQEIIYDCFIILDNSPSPKLKTWTSNEFNYCNILCETSGLLSGGVRGEDYDCV